MDKIDVDLTGIIGFSHEEKKILDNFYDMMQRNDSFGYTSTVVKSLIPELESMILKIEDAIEKDVEWFNEIPTSRRSLSEIIKGDA